MDSPLLDKLQLRWPTERWRGLTIVLGCSGGADSTALLLAICQLKPADTTVVVAHFNHRLRGAESDEDQRFIAELAERMGCAFVGGSAPHPPSPSPQKTGERGRYILGCSSSMKKQSSEASLRDVRYRFLQQTAAEQGARYVAVAHTADDCVETTLHNLARGTGLAGLTGIAPYRDLHPDLVLIRPLIDVWRNEVTEYLAKNGQGFRQDSSNASHVYTRNRIRHRWLPMLEEDLGADTRQAIYRSSTILAELHSWLRFQAREWLDQHTIQSNPHRVELRPSQRIETEWPVIQQALTILWQQQSWPLMAMTHAHWNQLRSLFQSPLTNSTAVELPSRIRVHRTDERWVIEMRNRI